MKILVKSLFPPYSVFNLCHAHVEEKSLIEMICANGERRWPNLGGIIKCSYEGFDSNV